MKRHTLWALLVLTTIFTIHDGVAAQESSDRTLRPSIRVVGEATLVVKPDLAEISIGVVSQSANAQAAADQNAQKVDATISALKRALPAADIRTISYTITPNYRYPKEGGTPTITGYTATNIIEVKINDITQVGRAIDTATQSGANTIHSLRFTLKDEQAARAQALRDATVRARAKAEAIASALGARVVRVLLAEERVSPSFEPRMAESMQARGGAADVATPIEAGNIDVRAMITLTVEISQ